MLVEELGRGGNEMLEVLRLQYDEIDARGVRAVVDAVKNGALPRLRRVELNGNKFSEEDPAVEALKSVLEERREKNEGDEKREKGGGDEDSVADEQWGLDDLSDLDEDSDEEDDQDEDADEVEELAEREVKDTEVAEEENVPQEDKSVDDLADQLGKTAI